MIHLKSITHKFKQMQTLTTVKKEENLLVVQNAFQDFLQGNITGIQNVCADDITWGAYSHPSVPYSKTYHGKKGVGEFFATLAAATDYKRFEPREFFADGDAVIVRGYHEAVVRSTGKTFGHDFMIHFRMKEGKVVDYFAFVDINDQANAFATN